MAIILKANKVNSFVSSVLFFFWYHSPNILDTPRIFGQWTVVNAVMSLWVLLDARYVDTQQRADHSLHKYSLFVLLLVSPYYYYFTVSKIIASQMSSFPAMGVQTFYRKVSGRLLCAG
jgi:hypothetical protein